MAQENRDMRMSEAEKKAAALPPKLTVPMILFFLPVLFVVILGPGRDPRDGDCSMTRERPAAPVDQVSCGGRRRLMQPRRRLSAASRAALASSRFCCASICRR